MRETDQLNVLLEVSLQLAQLLSGFLQLLLKLLDLDQTQTLYQSAKVSFFFFFELKAECRKSSDLQEALSVLLISH